MIQIHPGANGIDGDIAGIADGDRLEIPKKSFREQFKTAPHHPDKPSVGIGKRHGKHDNASVRVDACAQRDRNLWPQRIAGFRKVVPVMNVQTTTRIVARDVCENDPGAVIDHQGIEKGRKRLDTGQQGLGLIRRQVIFRMHIAYRRLQQLLTHGDTVIDIGGNALDDIIQIPESFVFDLLLGELKIEYADQRQAHQTQQDGQ